VSLARPHAAPCDCIACKLWDARAAHDTARGPLHCRWREVTGACPNCDEPTSWRCSDCGFCIACHYAPEVRDANSGHPEIERALARVLQ